jgi:preprotein translocase subunit YajC
MTLGFAAALALLQAAPAGPSPYGTFFMFGMIFLIFYFLLIRPQQKQRKKHEEAVRQVRRGDRIVTAGGLIGEVVHVKQAVGEGSAGPLPTMEDEVTIKSGESRLIVERGRIAKIVTPTGTSEAPPEKGSSPH